MTETPQQDRVNTENLRDYSQLRRSTGDRKVAGVAGGLGRHLNIDPTVLRVAFVVLCFFGGAGFVLYGAAWLFVPSDDKDHAAISSSPQTRNAVLIGAAVLAGCLLIGDSWGGVGFPWPLFLVGAGVLAFLLVRDRRAPATGGEPGPAGPDQPWLPEAAGHEPVPRPDRGPKLFWITVALVAIALGALGMYEASGRTVVDAAYPALALTVVGVMLVVGAWVGRAGGLLFLGILAAVILGIAQLSTSLSAGHLDRVPATAAQVQPAYEVGAGQIDLDLTQVRDLAALDGRTVDVTAGAGQLNLIVPDGLDVSVHSQVEYGGQIRIGADQRNGNHVVMDRLVDGGTDVPELTVNLDLKFGDISVSQKEASQS